MAATSLPDLPKDILLEIQSLLSYGSRLALWLTCCDLHFKVDNPNRTTGDILSGKKTYNIKDLLEVELWPEYNGAQHRSDGLKQSIRGLDYFACHICLKIRCASQFANAMMKGKRGKLGNGTTADKVGRFCVTYGISHGRYQRGTFLKFGGAFGSYGFVCRKCGGFEEALVGYDNKIAQRICTSCYEDISSLDGAWY